MSAAPVLLDEWRAPARGVRIQIEWLVELCDVSEQYVSSPLSVRLLRRKTGFSIPTRAWTDREAGRGNDRLASRRWARTALARGFGDRLGIPGGSS